VERSSVSNADARAGTGRERTPWHATQPAAPALDECGHHVAPMADWAPQLVDPAIQAEPAHGHARVGGGALAADCNRASVVIEGRFDQFPGEVWLNERG